MNRFVQRRVAIAIGLALSPMAACSSSSGNTPVELPADAAIEATVETVTTVDPNCDPALTYASFGQDFFATFCGRCHAWTQESAQLDGDGLAAAAGTSTSMPPSAPFPTADQRLKLVQWLACGAP